MPKVNADSQGHSNCLVILFLNPFYCINIVATLFASLSKGQDDFRWTMSQMLLNSRLIVKILVLNTSVGVSEV